MLYSYLANTSVIVIYCRSRFPQKFPKKSLINEKNIYFYLPLIRSECVSVCVYGGVGVYVF